MDIYKTYQNFLNKKLSPVEVLKDCLEKAKRSETNAYITRCDDLAMEAARRSEGRYEKNASLGELDGIPYSLKDLFVTKGIRTTAGSRYLYNYVGPYDGHVSSSLKEAGGVLVGKVGCDEFGMGSTNEKTPFGPVLNPINKEYVAGGSSGGSAASIGENSCLFSIGTDTGGSVRQPANFCGLVGLKPTYGRISRYGQIAYASSLDQASPMAKTTLDLACVLKYLTHKDKRDITNAPLKNIDIIQKLLATTPETLKKLRIGVPRELIDGCSSDVKKALLEALGLLQKNGATLIDIELPHLKYSVSVYYLIATSEASSNLARYDGIHYGLSSSSKADNLEKSYVNARTTGLGDEVKNRIMLGTFALSSGFQDEYFAKACKVRRLIAQDFSKALSQVDMVFSPVCATSAFKLFEGSQDILQMYMNDLYTIPVNLAGLPGLALPFGKTANGLPTGFQLIGKAFAEEQLLTVGRGFEILTEKGN